MKNMKIVICLFAAILLAGRAADAYVLMPPPQQILYEGKKVAAPANGIVLSSLFKSHDPRVPRSIKQVFPSAAVSGEAFPKTTGKTIIYATNSLDATAKKLCGAMMCGSINPKNMKPQSYFLGIRKLAGGVVVLILFNEPYGEFYAIKTLKQLYENGTLPEISIYDWPDFKARGILEGFYGKPWPAENRAALIPWLADYKFNIYIYAPKDDYKLRMGWRLSFSESELRKVTKLNELAKENFIKYCWELSPGMTVKFSSDKDLAAAYRKIKAIIVAGAECVALAFDDVNSELNADDRGKFDTYWQAQVGFTNKLLGKLMDEYPSVMFSFVPNDYWAALCEDSESLRYLGNNLDKRIHVGYTGNEIIPATITPSDVKYYEYYIKRKPILGDNFPVSDYVNEGGRLTLSPLRGRDPSLFRYVDVFVSNAMPLPESSKPSMLTISSYDWNPFNYDADEAWAQAMDILGGGKKGGDTLLFFAKQSESSLLWKYDSLDLFEATRGLMRAYKKLPDYKFDDWHGKTKAIFARFAGMDKEMQAAATPVNAGMMKEFQPWIKKLKDYGDIGLETIDLLKTKYETGKADSKTVDDLEATWKKCEENRAIITKMVMNNFMPRALAALRDQPEPDLKKYKSVLE